jgi:LysM repeat protein
MGEEVVVPAAVTEEPVAPTEEVEVPPEETVEPAPGEETAEPMPGTAEPLPTEEEALPPPEEPVPTEEMQLPATEEVPATDEPIPTEEPTPTEPIVTEEPTPTEVAQVTPTATTVPVPGPTATPTVGPTVIATVEAGCDTNTPPTAEANGPYTAMMGKGQAIVTFDSAGSNDPDGTITRYEWEFGDNSNSKTGQSVTHGYTQTGSYTARLTVTDNCGASGEDTAQVTISGPTPPTGTGTATPTATVSATPADPSSGTLGFCHRVDRGQTLSGIARFYGVPLETLATVNDVGMDYYVVAGQGLFIPTGDVKQGPNLYQVESGDTLDQIAFGCGLSTSTLAQANNLASGAQLTPGQTLIIPLWGQAFP